jgi:hypothetical protein
VSGAELVESENAEALGNHELCTDGRAASDGFSGPFGCAAVAAGGVDEAEHDEGYWSVEESSAVLGEGEGFGRVGVGGVPFAHAVLAAG